MENNFYDIIHESIEHCRQEIRETFPLLTSFERVIAFENLLKDFCKKVSEQEYFLPTKKYFDSHRFWQRDLFSSKDAEVLISLFENTRLVRYLESEVGV